MFRPLNISDKVIISRATKMCPRCGATTTTNVDTKREFDTLVETYFCANCKLTYKINYVSVNIDYEVV